MKKDLNEQFDIRHFSTIETTIPNARETIGQERYDVDLLPFFEFFG